MRKLVTQEEGFGLVELLIAVTVMALGISAIAAGFSSGILAVSRASQTATAGTLADQQMEAYRALPYKQIMVTPSTDATYTSDAAYAGSLTTASTPSWTSTQYDGSYCAGTTTTAATTVTPPTTSLSVSSASGLVIGTPILVDNPATSTAEVAYVTGISGTTLTLRAALARVHASGVAVTPVTCVPVRSHVTGPDHRDYRVDTFLGWFCAVGTLHTATYNGTTYTATAPGCTDTSTPPVSQALPIKQVTVVVRDGTTTTRTLIRETSTFDQKT